MSHLTQSRSENSSGIEIPKGLWLKTWSPVFTAWTRKWQPTSVFLPRESHGQRPWRTMVHGVAESRTRLKRLSMRSLLTPGRWHSWGRPLGCSVWKNRLGRFFFFLTLQYCIGFAIYRNDIVKCGFWFSSYRMASLTQWTWVWAKFQRQGRTGKYVVLQSMGSQRIRHDLATEQPIQ